MMKRNDGRTAAQLRPVTIQRDYLKHPEGSVLISMGDTKVICTASVQEGVPPFLRGSGKGWVTAEYQMLPRSTTTRMPRESVRGKVGGRTQEISRLIGRSLRAVTDMEKLGERSIQIDCDVIQADGGTRTASITGAMVALEDAVSLLEKEEKVGKGVLTGRLAAISVGIVAGQVMLDLDYSEDSRADVDMNVVMDGKGRFIELQSTAEKEAFGQAELIKMIGYAKKGIKTLLREQRKAC